LVLPGILVRPQVSRQVVGALVDALAEVANVSGCGGGRWGASPRSFHERLLRELIGGRSARKRLNRAEQVGASGVTQNVNAILLHGPEESRFCNLLARGKHGRGEVEGRTRWGR
jgi:Arc/MetJ family transcription regulator